VRGSYKDSKQVFPTDKYIHCGKNAAAEEMGLNVGITDHQGDRAEITVSLYMWSLYVSRKWMPGQKYHGPRRGWEQDLKLVCLPLTPPKVKMNYNEIMIPKGDRGYGCVIPDKPCYWPAKWKTDDVNFYAFADTGGKVCASANNQYHRGRWRGEKTVRCKSPPKKHFWTKCYTNKMCEDRPGAGSYWNKRDKCIEDECKNGGGKWKGKWHDCGKDDRNKWWHFKGECVPTGHW